MKKCLMLTLTLTLLATSALQAHDLFITKKGSEFVVLFGHADKGKYANYKMEYLKKVKAYDQNGNNVAAKISPHGQGAAVTSSKTPAVITLVYDPGFMVKTTEGYKNISKRNATNIIESWKGATFNKNIWQWNDRFAKPLGAKVEILSLKNPLALKVGDSLPIQVFYEGNPAAGLTIKSGDPAQKGLTTDKDGKAMITLKKSGLQVIKATRKIPLQNNPDADFLRESATIVFTIQ